LATKKAHQELLVVVVSEEGDGHESALSEAVHAAGLLHLLLETVEERVHLELLASGIATVRPGTDFMILKNIFTKIAFLLKTKLNYAKI
jgi:hypothetical protein